MPEFVAPDPANPDTFEQKDAYIDAVYPIRAAGFGYGHYLGESGANRAFCITVVPIGDDEEPLSFLLPFNQMFKLRDTLEGLIDAYNTHGFDVP